MPSTNSFQTILGEKYIFNVSGFKIGVAIDYGVVSAIVYKPQTPLTRKQGEEILAKNSNTSWKKDEDGCNEETDALATKGNNKHDLRGVLHFLSPNDHDSIQYVVIYDGTIVTQINNQAEAANQEKKAEEAKKTQDNVNGL